jgi:hypothetical protein
MWRRVFSFSTRYDVASKKKSAPKKAPAKPMGKGKGKGKMGGEKC